MSDTLTTRIKEYIASFGNKFYAPDKERFMATCLQNSLDPLLGDVVYQPRTSQGQISKGSIVTSFEIFLAKACETGCFLGVDDTVVNDSEGKISGVRVIAKRELASGKIAELSFTAYTTEFQPAKITSYSPWSTMLYVMLRKCAISNAVRQLFADKIRLPYTKEEMEQDTHIEKQEVMYSEPQQKKESAQEQKKSSTLFDKPPAEFTNILIKGGFREAKNHEDRCLNVINTMINYINHNNLKIEIPRVKDSEAAQFLFDRILALNTRTTDFAANPFDKKQAPDYSNPPLSPQELDNEKYLTLEFYTEIQEAIEAVESGGLDNSEQAQLQKKFIPLISKFIPAGNFSSKNFIDGLYALSDFIDNNTNKE